MTNDARCAMNRHEQLLNLAWILLGGWPAPIRPAWASWRAPSWQRAGPVSGRGDPRAGRFGAVCSRVPGRRWLWRPSSFWPSATCRNRTLLVLAGFLRYGVPHAQAGLSAVRGPGHLVSPLRDRAPAPAQHYVIRLVVTCLLVYGLFVALLRVNLPRGILGVLRGSIMEAVPQPGDRLRGRPEPLRTFSIASSDVLVGTLVGVLPGIGPVVALPCCP